LFSGGVKKDLDDIAAAGRNELKNAGDNGSHVDLVKLGVSDKKNPSKIRNPYNIAYLQNYN
jgi:hypothetical protein